jgi:hypothetical protein
MDSISEQHGTLSDFYDGSLDVDVDAGDLVLYDGHYPMTPAPTRFGVDMPALAAAAPHVGAIQVAGPLATLRDHWAALPPLAKVALGLVAGAVAISGAAWVLGAFGGKTLVGHAALTAATTAAVL